MKKKRKFAYFAFLLLISLLMGELSYPAAESVSGAIEAAAQAEGYIRWIDFTPSEAALSDAARIDVETYGSERHIRMHELLAVYSANTGGSYKNYKSTSLSSIREKYAGGASLAEMVTNTKLLDYYLESYEAVIGGFVGEYRKLDMSGRMTGDNGYGVRVFSPIAGGYYYNHYDDFGASRSFGYKRSHLGHDLMGSVGTPVIAIESGYVEACGWNAYGGWRIGIRSFDGKRYYYYAHLRKGHPYNDIYEGKIVNAGEVIGYLGMTGYSTKEDTNNINVPHLHFGMQVIFDASQKDGYNQIWIDMYAITNFLSRHKVKTKKSGSDSFSQYTYFYPTSPD